MPARTDSPDLLTQLFAPQNTVRQLQSPLRKCRFPNLQAKTGHRQGNEVARHGPPIGFARFEIDLVESRLWVALKLFQTHEGDGGGLGDGWAVRPQALTAGLLSGMLLRSVAPPGTVVVTRGGGGEDQLVVDGILRSCRIRRAQKQQSQK